MTRRPVLAGRRPPTEPEQEHPLSQAITLRQWTDVIRRARLGRTVKAVALVLATYADSDGTRVRPGLARVAWECEITYNTAQKAVTALRKAQLIQLVRQGGRKGGRRRDADEYRLTLGPDLLEHVDVPTPAAAEVEIERIRRAKQGQFKDEPHPTPMGAVDDRSHPTALGAVEGEEGRSHPTALGLVDENGPRPHPTAWGAEATTAPHGAVRETPTAPHGAHRPHPTPWGPTVHDRDTSTTAHSDEEVVTTSHGPRAGAAEDDRDFADEVKARQATLAPPRCAHGMQGGNRASDGKPNCPICRALGVVAEAVIPTPRGAPA